MSPAPGKASVVKALPSSANAWSSKLKIVSSQLVKGLVFKVCLCFKKGSLSSSQLLSPSSVYLRLCSRRQFDRKRRFHHPVQGGRWALRRHDQVDGRRSQVQGPHRVHGPQSQAPQRRPGHVRRLRWILDRHHQLQRCGCWWRRLVEGRPQHQDHRHLQCLKWIKLYLHLSVLICTWIFVQICLDHSVIKDLAIANVLPNWSYWMVSYTKWEAHYNWMTTSC